MPEDILVRQKSLGLTLPRSVAVVGCGGVGSWTALFLALAGVPRLYLFDGDTVSSSNLNRLPVSSEEIGESKSVAISVIITAFRPECDAIALGPWSSATADAMKLADDIDWLVCTTDTLASRQAAHKWCQKWAADENLKTSPPGYPKYIEAAAEGEFGSATGEPAQWASELEADPGYASVPVWVGPCVMAAAFACAHILHNSPMNYLIRQGFSDKGRITTQVAND